MRRICALVLLVCMTLGVCAQAEDAASAAEELVFPSDTGGWTLKNFKIKSLIIHDTEVIYENGLFYGSMTNDEYVYVSDDLKSWKRAGIRPSGWYSPEEDNWLTWAPCYVKLHQPYVVDGESYEYALFDALSVWGSQDARIRCFVMKEPAPDSKADYYYVGDVMASGKYAAKEVVDPRKSYEAEETGAEGPRYYYVEGYESGHSVDKANGWNAIDPTVLYDHEGRLMMVFGSWFGGIYVTELDQTTLMPVSNRAEDYTRIAYHTEGLCMEGATVFYHDGYYYLNVAYGDICYSYNTRIARAESIEGPYVDYNGASMLEADGAVGTRIVGPYRFERDKGWRGQGHNAWVYHPDTGEYFMLTNGRTVEDEYARQIVRSVYWLDGWPVLSPEIATADTVRAILDGDGNAIQAAAAAPAVQGIDASLLPGEYEIIVFAREREQYEDEERQDESRRITLAADGAVSGAYTGEWVQRDGNTLTMTLDGRETTLFVTVGYDWEKGRSGILVMSGLTAPGEADDPMAGTAVWLKGVSTLLTEEGGS